MSSILGAQIRAARIAAGLDTATAAKRLRIGTAYLTKIEQRADVPPRLASRAASAYRCDEGLFYIIQIESPAAAPNMHAAVTSSATGPGVTTPPATSRSASIDRGSGLRGPNIVTNREAAGTAASHSFRNSHNNRRNQ